MKGIEGKKFRVMSVDRAGKKCRRESDGDPAMNWII